MQFIITWNNAKFFSSSSWGTNNFYFHYSESLLFLQKQIEIIDIHLQRIEISSVKDLFSVFRIAILTLPLMSIIKNNSKLCSYSLMYQDRRPCMWRRGAVVISTAQLHSIKPELRYCAGSNPACGFARDSRWWGSLTMVSAGNKT